jgi:PAS domain S-box-containing protein
VSLALTTVIAALALMLLVAVCVVVSLIRAIDARDAPNGTDRCVTPGWSRAIPGAGALVEAFERIARLKNSEFEANSRYKTLTDNVAAAVIIHHNDGAIEWCSPYTEVLTGFSLSEIYAERGDFILSRVHDDDRDTLKNALAIVASGEPYQYRYRFYHRSGLALWLETRTVPIFDPVTDSSKALSITLDVTAAVNNQLTIEARNRDLNEFTYMLSHDLKAPIVTIRGMLEVARAESSTAPNGKALNEAFEYMGRATGRLEQLVGGVLELARVSATDKVQEPINLGDTLNEVLEDYRVYIERAGAKITTVGELPWVLGDKTQLYQIFSNLVGNAIKYRDPERPLIVSISDEAKNSRRRVMVTVRDNGRGIAPEHCESIFNPFNRAGESIIDGSGVGLSCVKRLVEKLGGSISVESEVGVGSAFSVDLRRAER